MQFKVGFRTDIGRKRTQNQDSGIALPDLGLFVVSDGMGGHKGGEIASATAVEAISSCVRNSNHREEDPLGTLVKSLQSANEAIYARALTDPQLQGMGTTTTALLFHENRALIGHVGDSRCYSIRPHAIWQITRDHSLVQEKLRAGLITREEVKNDRMKNVITRSVGFENEVNVETYQMEVQSGDCFLLCSDGLTGLIDDSLILQIIQKNALNEGDLQKAVDSLVASANASGGDDNITSILVQVI